MQYRWSFAILDAMRSLYLLCKHGGYAQYYTDLASVFPGVTVQGERLRLNQTPLLDIKPAHDVLESPGEEELFSAFQATGQLEGDDIQLVLARLESLLTAGIEPSISLTLDALKFALEGYDDDWLE